MIKDDEIDEDLRYEIVRWLTERLRNLKIRQKDVDKKFYKDTTTMLEKGIKFIESLPTKKG